MCEEIQLTQLDLNRACNSKLSLTAVLYILVVDSEYARAKVSLN